MIFPPLVESGRIVTLPTLVAELAEETGQRLAVDPELKNEAIYLRGITLDAKAIRNLARACAAEWVTNGSTSLLCRPPGLRSILAKEESRTFLAEVRAAYPLDASTVDEKGFEAVLSPLRVAIQKASSKRPTDIKAMTTVLGQVRKKSFPLLAKADPLNRAVSRIFAAVDFGKAASLAPGRSLSFTNQAGRRSLLIPNAKRILSHFQEDTLAYSRMSRSQGQVFTAATRAAKPDAVWPVERPPAPIPPPPVWLSLAFLQGSGAQIQIGVNLLDEGGNSLSGDTFDWSPKPPIASDFPYPTEFSAESIPMNPRLQHAQGLLGNSPEDTTPWGTNLLDGGKLDPLSAFAAPFLDGVAEAVHLPVMIDLPDAFLDHLSLQSLPEINERIGIFVRLQRVNGVVVGAPRSPLRTTLGRFPRRAIPDLIRLASAPIVDLDEAARYVNQVGGTKILEENLWETIAIADLWKFDLRNRLLSSDFEHRNWIALLAELTPAQRSTISEGGDIPFTGLLPAAQAAMADLVYTFSPVRDMVQAPAVLTHPDGLPLKATLAGKRVEEVPMLRITSPGVESSESHSRTASAFGGDLWDEDEARKSGRGDYDSRKGKLFPILQRNVVASVLIHDELISRFTLPSPTPLSHEPVLFDRLPPEFLREIQRGYDEAKARTLQSDR